MMGLGLWRPTLLLLMVLIFIVGSGLLFYQQIYLSRAEDVEQASGAATVPSDELVTSVGEQENSFTTGEKQTQVQSEDIISPPVVANQTTTGASIVFLPSTPPSTTSNSNSSDSSNNGNDSTTIQGEQLPAGKQTPVASESAVISASSAATVVNPVLTSLVNMNKSYRSKLLGGHDEVVTPMIHLGCSDPNCAKNACPEDKPSLCFYCKNDQYYLVTISFGHIAQCKLCANLVANCFTCTQTSCTSCQDGYTLTAPKIGRASCRERV